MLPRHVEGRGRPQVRRDGGEHVRTKADGLMPEPAGADERDRKLVDRYDAHAAAYQRLWAPILRLASVPLIRELPEDGVRRVIDIGTGVGALWPDVFAAYPNVRLVGLDRSQGMLKLAPAGPARLVADARAVPLPPASMDLALLIFMLFHLADPAAGIREARRLLRPGGAVGTITWGCDLASSATRIWTGCLERYGAAPLDPQTQARHDLVDTPEKMEMLLRDAGFSGVRAWADDLVTVIPLEQLIALKTSLGSEKARFDSLDDQTRSECAAEARERLRVLEPDGFTATGTIVYAVAT